MTKIQICDLLNTGDETAAAAQNMDRVTQSWTSPTVGTKAGTEESKADSKKKMATKMQRMCMSNSPRGVDGVITGFIQSSDALQRTGEIQSSNAIKAADIGHVKYFGQSPNWAKEEAELKEGEESEECVAEQPFLRQILEDLVARSTGWDNESCKAPSEGASEQESEENKLGICPRLCNHERSGESETLVLPNVYVERSDMDWVMDARLILPEAEIEESLSGSDILEVSKKWKIDALLVRERREKRRNAARVARMEKEESRSDGEITGVRSEKTLEKRMKNRAAVNKCRLKQKERIERFEKEQRELERENRVMREALRIVEQWGGLKDFANDV